MSWSYLYLGYADLTQINKNSMVFTLRENQTIGGIYFKTQKGPRGSHPPKKIVVKRDVMRRILEYSPKKKKANPMAEYSTLYPATSSASASGKSKGILLVSAKIEIKNIIAKGSIGITSQTVF